MNIPVEILIGFKGYAVYRPTERSTMLMRQLWEKLELQSPEHEPPRSAIECTESVWLSGWTLQGFYGCSSEGAPEVLAVVVHTATGHFDTISASRLRQTPESPTARTDYKLPPINRERTPI